MKRTLVLAILAAGTLLAGASRPAQAETYYVRSAGHWVVVKTRPRHGRYYVRRGTRYVPVVITDTRSRWHHDRDWHHNHDWNHHHHGDWIHHHVDHGDHHHD
jgi:hypothetical protein